ncbi:MAG: prepilin peptidase [bacterium]
MFELAQTPAIAIPVALLLGLIVGSFLNVVIFRLPRRMEQELADACAGDEVEDYEPRNQWFGLKFLISPASTCQSCGHKIRAWENIPIVSYLLQGGKCTACGTPLSIQYPIVEALTGILSAIIVAILGATWAGLYALLLTWALIAMSVIDIRHQLLPDVLVLPLLWLGLLINLNGTFTDIPSAILGATFGYLALWFIYHLFLLISGKEGMGYGDFKLLSMFGAWLGWQMLPQILLLSTLVGAIVGIALIVIKGRDKNIPIPFGPYLATAGWVALLWGEQINQSYMQFAKF